jgi:CheY-like chemotaxis protein
MNLLAISALVNNSLLLKISIYLKLPFMSSTAYSQLHVLIVDDFNSFRQTLNKIMRELGFKHVDSVKSGEEALKAFKKHHYDLVLCDYNLGAGQNGQQVLEELRKDSRIKPQDIFILISAETSRNVVMSAFDCEPDAYLSKPISTKTIEQRVKRLLNKRKELLDFYNSLNKVDKRSSIALLEQKIVEKSRYSMDCQKLLTELYIETQQFDEAEVICRATLEIRSLDWAQLGLAKTQLARGNVAKAIEWLKDIIRVKPSYMKAYDILAQAHQVVNDDEQLQITLEKAVEVSPMSLARQLSLAEVAMENGDAEIAANAYRKILRYGSNTAYFNTRNQINFAKSFIRFFEQDPDKANGLIQDAVKTLSIVSDKDAVMPEIKTLAKIYMGQMLGLQKQHKKSKDIINPILNSLEKQENISPDIEIELINSYIYNQQLDLANLKSKELIEKYSDNESVLEKIDYLMHEPVSIKGKSILQKDNKKGIDFYKIKDNLSAISCFYKLEKRYPRFTAVKLNLFQAIMGYMKDVGKDADSVARCTRILTFLKTHIKSGDIHFDRCQQLQGMLSALIIRKGEK